MAVAFMVIIVGGVSYGFLMNGLAERSSLQNTEDTMRALEIAEAGTVKAEMELFGQKDADGDGLGTLSGSYGGGTYQVVAAAYPGDADRFTLTASATHRLASRRIEVGLRLIRAARFKVAAFGDDAVLVTGGGSTDAYDSRLGSYEEQAKNEDEHGTFAEEGGSLGSNGTIEVDGDVTIVRGDANPGPGESVTGTGTVTGSTEARSSEQYIPPVTYEEFVSVMLANDNDQLLGEPWYDADRMAIVVKGKKKVALPPGTYFLRDFVVGTFAQLTVNGPVTIYATGNVSLTAHTFVNKTGRPEDCQILHQAYALPPGRPVYDGPLKVTSHSTMALTLFAPDAAINVTADGSFFGALVGKHIKFAGTGKLHYDKALGEIGSNEIVRVQRLYWRDVAPPRR